MRILGRAKALSGFWWALVGAEGIEKDPAPRLERGPSVWEGRLPYGCLRIICGSLKDPSPFCRNSQVPPRTAPLFQA